MDIHQFLGIISAILVFGSGYWYVHDTLYGTTRPNKVTWLGWLLLVGTSFLIQATNNPDYSVYFMGADFLFCVVLVVLAFYKGITEFTMLDCICLVLGGIGFILWLVLNEPVLALIANIAADLCFAVPTVLKSYLDPDSESIASWRTAAIGMFLGLLSKTDFGYINTLFPLYLFIINMIIYLLCTRIPQKLLGRLKVS